LLNLRVGYNVRQESVNRVRVKRDKVPDFDSGLGGSGNPLEFRVECDLVDLCLGIEFSGWGR
jgi:hypothetical protein